ncbi:hypothetical protein [Heyndrickxia acidicola]|uniref:Uncharacterized protein n=1 Tax=Heyndrickxia acidicola TaxID=209389 RepID=A0ABU6MD23_9BACI|nr:hypothetical protein [Heyndrickxia acidicola]MED1202570.1 hypothetical protein [Heyndrickxia acidicola]
MKIQTTSFNTFFPKFENLRYKLFDFEEKLQNYFIKPFNTIPVPDQAPAEIPRIHANSHHGHSELNVSLDRLSFVTNYDERFSEWKQHHTYLSERIFPMTSIIKDLVNNQFLYSGLTTDILVEEVAEEPIKHIFNKFLNFQTNSNPYDCNLKLTYVLKDKYYLNLTISNIRWYSGSGNPELALPAYLEEAGRGIILNLDINDRYAYNYKKGYTSKSEEVDEILDITSDIIENKVNDIVLNGVIDL